MPCCRRVVPGASSPPSVHHPGQNSQRPTYPVHPVTVQGTLLRLDPVRARNIAADIVFTGLVDRIRGAGEFGYRTVLSQKTGPGSTMFQTVPVAMRGLSTARGRQARGAGGSPPSPPGRRWPTGKRIYCAGYPGDCGQRRAGRAWSVRIGKRRAATDQPRQPGRGAARTLLQLRRYGQSLWRTRAPSAGLAALPAGRHRPALAPPDQWPAAHRGLSRPTTTVRTPGRRGSTARPRRPLPTTTAVARRREDGRRWTRRVRTAATRAAKPQRSLESIKYRYHQHRGMWLLSK